MNAMRKFTGLLIFVISLGMLTACATYSEPKNNFDGANSNHKVISLDDPVSLVAQSLAEQITASYHFDSEIQRIALLPLRIQYPNQREIAETFNDTLRIELVLLKKYDIVADNDMRRVLSQINISSKLQNEGYIDRDTLKRAGKLVNADAIIDGSMTKVDYKTQRITVELISLSTGTVVAAGQSILRQ